VAKVLVEQVFTRLYFNPRKLRGRQIKWVRQYEGPFLVVKMPSALTAKIQRTPEATPKRVHIDKLKDFVGTPPRSWINGAAENTITTEVLSPVEQPICCDVNEAESVCKSYCVLYLFCCTIYVLHYIITSAKEVMFLPDFVCLSVCLSVC